VLVVALAALTVGAAVVGFVGGPSPEQISLQIAAQRSADASNFTFTVESQIPSIGAHSSAHVERAKGIWQSPDRWRVTSVNNGTISVVSGSGSTFQDSAPHLPSVTFELGSHTVESLTNPDSPVLSVPPIGLLFSATDVTRHGDHYAFDVPRLYTGKSGWVAYASLSHAAIQLPLTAAFNTRVEATIKNGYVVSLSFPRGTSIRNRTDRTLNAWQLSDFNTSPLTKASESGKD